MSNIDNLLEIIEPKKKTKKTKDIKMTKDQKKGSIKQHNNEIKRLKQQIAKHKLLKRQVRLSYRISTGKRWF